MVSKVRVYGKAQKRTALGIIHAYHVMYPHATMEDFIKAFPKELALDTGTSVIFKPLSEVTEKEKGNPPLFYSEEDEVLHLQDGTVMAICGIWTKTSFDNIVRHATQYGIEVAEFEKTMKGEKGGFRLEYLNGYVPPVPTEEKKKSMPAWLWAVIALAVLGILAAVFFMGRSGKTEPAVAVADTIVVHDTIYQEKIEELETKFNAAQFEKGKTDLNDDAKFVLHDLAKLLEKNADVKLKIEGHTSAEGDAAANQKLSEERAKATVDFLISQGVDESRLSFEGLGSSKLKNTENPEAEENRRTEFKIEN